MVINLLNSKMKALLRIDVGKKDEFLDLPNSSGCK
jgi:hypothetical protein